MKNIYIYIYIYIYVEYIYIYILIKRHKLVYYFYKKTNFFIKKKNQLRQKGKNKQPIGTYMYI